MQKDLDFKDGGDGSRSTTQFISGMTSTTAASGFQAKRTDSMRGNSFHRMDSHLSANNKAESNQNLKQPSEHNLRNSVIVRNSMKNQSMQEGGGAGESNLESSHVIPNSSKNQQEIAS